MTMLEMECETEVEAHQQRVSGEAGVAMEHSEAIEMMASEKYLLDELTPELRDAYEEHYFGCAECAHDVQLGAAFIDQAKVILPGMMAQAAAVRPLPARPDALRPSEETRPAKQPREWFAWLGPMMRPAMMVPAFACLLAIVGYQNVVVYPALQAAATEPRILPSATVLRDGTRSGVPVINADLKLGSTITVELPAGAHYNSYKLDFYDSKGKAIWTRTAPSDTKNDDTISFWLSSSVKQDTYKLVISGLDSGAGLVEVKQQMFDLRTKSNGQDTK